MKKTFFKNLVLVLLATTLFTCGSFLMSNRVYADSITVDGVDLTVDSYRTDSTGKIIEIVKNGLKYLATGWAKSNVESNNLWAKSVASGVLTFQSINAINDVVSTADGISDWVLDGVEYGKDLISDGWDSLKSKFVEGSLEPNSVRLMKKMLGAVGDIDDVYTDVKTAVSGLATDVISTYRNYYTGTLTGTNSYATGTTKYYSVYNDNTKTIYDTVNNTYNTVNNYTYDIYNDYYTYYTTNNYYQVSNTYNNTYVFNNSGNYDYSLYYALPDGSNSFNLTADDINGIRVDLNVDNYELNNANSDVLGLYHLNGNNLNTYDIDSSNIFENNINKFPFSSNNYVDSLLGFDTAYMDTGKSDIFTVIDDSIKNVRFYLYPAKSNLTNINFYPFKNPHCFISLPTNSFSLIELNGSDVYVNGSLTDYNVQLVGSNDLPNIVNTTITGVVPSSHKYGNNPFYGFVIEVIDATYTISDLHYEKVGYYYYLTGDYVSIGRYQEEAGESWKTYNVNRKVYLDSITGYFDSTGLPSLRLASNDDIDVISPRFSQAVDYYILDELRLSNVLNNNHGVNFLPFADGLYYTLPLTDTNNKLLIQSDIAVNNFQFGGIRESYSNSVKGDVYVALTNNYIDVIEQFDGHDWISVNGAIYSTYLGKWVNAVGYSVLTGDWSYSDITANDVDDTSSLAKWLSGVLNGISNAISNGFDNVVNGLKDLVGIGSDTSSIDSDVVSYVDSVTEAESDLQQYTHDFEEETELKTLATTVSGVFDVFDDNGLQVLYTAPLILLILRMII